MTVVGYIFLDVNRDNLIPLAVQQQMLEEYAGEAGLRVDELLVEQSYSLETPFMERDEGKRLLENVQAGDMVFTTRAKWVLGTAQEALLLIGILKEKKVSLFCVDLDGDIVQEAERKLVVSQGIAPLVQKVCEALSVKMERGRHAAAIRESKARQKKVGKYLDGPIPFGFQVDEGGRLQQNTEQQIIIDKMISMEGGSLVIPGYREKNAGRAWPEIFSRRYPPDFVEKKEKIVVEVLSKHPNTPQVSDRLRGSISTFTKFLSKKHEKNL